MNVVRFREYLKRVCDYGAIRKAALHQLLHSPIFAYDRQGATIAGNELEWCENNLCSKEAECSQIPTRLPFPVFSIMLRQHEHDDPDVEPIGIIVYGDRINFTDPHGERNQSLLTLFNMFKIDGVECWSMCYHTGRIKNGIVMQTWKNGVAYTPQQSVQEIAQLGRSVLLTLCFELFSTNSAAIKVEPKPEGRSVEWVLSRTHYLILGKKQAQALRDKKKGASDHDIKRGAHWRRAHLRRLTSDKFTNKKGMLVPVKHAWIGPTEWLGIDGKTYKVVNVEKEKAA